MLQALALTLLGVVGAAEPADPPPQGPPGRQELDLLRKLSTEDPEAAERAIAAAIAGIPGEASFERARAELFDLRGQSLGRLNRLPEAADAFHAALALDEGTNRLTWTLEDGRPAWTAAIDPGDGRLERAARSYLAAKRTDAARPVLAHALAAGAEDWTREAWALVGGGSVPGLDSTASELTAGTWYPPVPDVELRLHDGTSMRLSSARGKVLLLDFWASWCAPCLQELPRLQALQESLRESGLLVVTVNARESAQAARNTAQTLGLTLPVGFYDNAIDRALNVKTLPTIVLCDRDGRIRARWDAYVPDFEGQVAARVRGLLKNESDDPPRKAADVLAGGGLLRLAWVRELARPIAGLAVVTGAKGEPRVAVAAGEHLLLVRPDGSLEDRHEVPGGKMGRLVRTESSADSRFDLVSYRPGARDLVWIDSLGGVTHVETAGAPVFDVAALPGAARPPRRPRVALGGLEGLTTSDAAGEEVAFKEAAGEIVSVAASASGGSSRVVVLLRDGTLLGLDGTGRTVTRRSAPGGSQRLLLGGDAVAGLGFLTSQPVAAVVGKPFESGRAHAAIATGGGQLVIVDLVTGAVRFRALWPGITDLVLGDLDGDGRDDLVVASGRNLALLSPAP